MQRKQWGVINCPQSVHSSQCDSFTPYPIPIAAGALTRPQEIELGQGKQGGGEGISLRAFC